MHFQLTADSSSSTPRIWWSTKAATIFLDGSGPTLGLWGGTLLQWLVPFLLAVYFFNERHTAGIVLCLFFFFENWLYTATYMADARAQVLPLVTTGDPEFAEHDFFRIFSDLGVLNYDTKIAAVVRLLGWCGMIAVVVWFALRPSGRKKQPEEHTTFETRFPSTIAPGGPTKPEIYPGPKFAFSGSPKFE